MSIPLSAALAGLGDEPRDHFIGGKVPTHEELDLYSGLVPDGVTAPCHEGIVAMFTEGQNADVHGNCPTDRVDHKPEASGPSKMSVIRQTLTDLHPKLLEIAVKLFGDDQIVDGHERMFLACHKIVTRNENRELLGLIDAIAAAPALNNDRRQLLENYRQMLDRGVRNWDLMEEEILELHLANIATFAIGCECSIVQYLESLSLSHRGDMLHDISDSRFNGFDRCSAVQLAIASTGSRPCGSKQHGSDN
jgi:hypothetical protein